MRKINCARCRTRRVTKSNRVGAKNLWEAFCKLVGSEWTKYSKEDLICNHCNAEVANVKMRGMHQDQDNSGQNGSSKRARMERLDTNEEEAAVMMVGEDHSVISINERAVFDDPNTEHSQDSSEKMEMISSIRCNNSYEVSNIATDKDFHQHEDYELDLLEATWNSDIALYPSNSESQCMSEMEMSLVGGYKNQGKWHQDEKIVKDVLYQSQLEMDSENRLDTSFDQDSQNLEQMNDFDVTHVQDTPSGDQSAHDNLSQTESASVSEQSGSAQGQNDHQSEVTSSYTRDSQLSISLSSISSVSRASSSNHLKSVHVINGIRGYASSQSHCFLCRSPTGRCRVPQFAVKDIWLRKKVYIAPGSRCCRLHLHGKRFTEEASEVIEGTRNHVRVTDSELVEWINVITEEATKKRLPLDFSEDSHMTSEDYEIFTGLNRDQFETLLKYCENDLRDSPVRTSRNALAVFLIKLRLDLPQRILAFLFGIQYQPRISDIIRSVTKSLHKRFVPQYLGYDHISREDISAHHTSGFAKKLLSLQPGKICLVLDATYLYLQKSSNLEFQRMTYSNHKHRNLCKPMVVTTDTGYIVAAEGPFYGDNGNNDGKILLSMLLVVDGETKTFSSFIHHKDMLVLDRGFRDATAKLQELGIDYLVPHLLKKAQKQFTTKEANESRKCTKIRWVVEAAHGRVKSKFSFFESVVSAPYFDIVGPMYQISCAIMNKFFTPDPRRFDTDENLADNILDQMEKENELQKEIEDKGLERKRSVWVEASAREIYDFPELSLDDLKKLTLGTYQIKMSENYTAQHLMENSCYRIMICKDQENLVRAKIQSRFRKSEGHHLWVKYQQDGEGAEAILGWYCNCKNGSRTVGMCSHICSVLWFIGYATFHPELSNKRKKKSVKFIDALANINANRVEDEEPDLSEDEGEVFR